MHTEVDVFISNYTLVDPEVYQLWIDGFSCKYTSIYFKLTLIQYLLLLLLYIEAAIGSLVSVSDR